MQTLMVASGATYAAKVGGGTIASADEVNLLDTGALAFFDMSGTLMITSTTLTTQNKFYVALGQGLGVDSNRLEPKISVVIPRDIYALSKKAAVTPVKQVDTIGADGSSGSANNLPSSPIPGTLASILIVDTSLPVQNLVLPKYRYEYRVKVGDTPTLILNGLIALINADGNAIVVATAHGSTDGIALTAKDFNKSFDTSVGYTSPDDILVNATVQTGVPAASGTSVALVYSFGQSGDVLAIEQVYSTTDGNTNQTWLSQFYWKKLSLVVPGDTYKLDTLTFPLNHETAIDKVHATTQAFIIALKTGSAQLTSVETILGILFSATTVV